MKKKPQKIDCNVQYSYLQYGIISSPCSDIELESNSGLRMGFHGQGLSTGCESQKMGRDQLGPGESSKDSAMSTPNRYRWPHGVYQVGGELTIGHWRSLQEGQRSRTKGSRLIGVDAKQWSWTVSHQVEAEPQTA